MLVPVVGPSGAGKDTLMEAARARLAGDPRFLFARRCITRPAEAGGEDHEATTPESFDAARDRGEFMLWWEAHGLRYGVPRAYGDAVDRGQVVVVNLSRSVLLDAAARWPMRILLITAPTELLAQRLAARGRETPEDVAARLARDATVPAGLPVETVRNDSSVEEGVARVLAALNRAAEDARQPGRVRLARPG